MSEGKRRLAAIMFTDMVGYTALGQKNESLSLALVDTQKKLIRPILGRHEGREVKTMGDSFLVEFPSALNAVRCAYDIQRTAREFNIPLPEQTRIHLRIGVHLGDVIDSQGDILGDAVNVASRINYLADDGGVCLTRQVYDHVQTKFELPLTSLGPRSLKNVNIPVEVYRVQMPWDEKRAAQLAELDKSRIVVLPFANMSPDPADEYFADGLTEELISKLSLVKGLKVIARTSAMSYKRKEKRISEIGMELRVGSIVEGSVRKAGDRIRVTTQLIDAKDDQHVWSQTYNRNLDDVFAVQTDIAKRVSDALKVKILELETDSIDRKPTENTKAYTLYLRGRYFWNKRGIENMKKAEEYFEQAVHEDPNFALGYAGIADCNEVLSSNWSIEITARHEKARAMITKALEIDQDLAEAHAIKGVVMQHDFNLRDAENEFRRAIELKPRYATAHLWYCRLLVRGGRWDEALRHIEKALELDPLSQIIGLNHAEYYYFRREYVKALDLYKKAVELDPSVVLAHFGLASVYGKMKMFDEMERECKVGVGLVQAAYPQAVSGADSMVAYFKGDREKVRRLLPDLEAHIEEPLSPKAVTIAGLYFFLAENDKGFEWLEKSYSRKEFNLLYLEIDDRFDGVRADPRYRNLVERVGLL